MMYSILLFEIVFFSVKLNIFIKKVIMTYPSRKGAEPRTGTCIFAHDSAGLPRIPNNAWHD
jgi:hypothetical protein